jgi:diacylglycerol kinase family enzyme
VVVEKNNLLLLPFRVLWHIRFGTFTKPEAKSHGISYFQTKSLIIHNPSLAMLHVDGDGSETAELIKVEILNNAYHLLVP